MCHLYFRILLTRFPWESFYWVTLAYKPLLIFPLITFSHKIFILRFSLWQNTSILMDLILQLSVNTDVHPLLVAFAHFWTYTKCLFSRTFNAGQQEVDIFVWKEWENLNIQKVSERKYGNVLQSLNPEVLSSKCSMLRWVESCEGSHLKIPHILNAIASFL